MEALIYKQLVLFLDKFQDCVRGYTGLVATLSTIRLEIHSRLH